MAEEGAGPALPAVESLIGAPDTAAPDGGEARARIDAALADMQEPSDDSAVASKAAAESDTADARGRGRPKGTRDKKPRKKRSGRHKTRAELQIERDEARAALAQAQEATASTDVATVGTATVEVAESPAPPDPTLLVKPLTMAVVIGFSRAAAVRHPHWTVPESEARELAELAAPVLAPYCGGVAKALPALAPALKLLELLAARLELDRKVASGALSQEDAVAVIEGRRTA